MDADHSNAFAAWQAMGRPETPSAQDYARLEAAAGLAEIGAATSVPVSDGAIALRISLPRQGVSLLRLEWP